MKKLPDIPLSPEAEALVARMLPEIQRGLESIGHIPVSVLVWGPGLISASPLASVRENFEPRCGSWGMPRSLAKNYAIRRRRIR